MALHATRRFAFVAAASAGLAGCARDRPIVLDRQAMTGIKRIGLPTVGVPNTPDVRVLNGVSTAIAGMGLIGAVANISGSIVRGNRSASLVHMMAARGLDPGPALTEMLAAALGAKGFSVVPSTADPKRRFLPSIGAAPEYDAVLDCYIPTYGFTALNDSDTSPYRATIIVQTRLVSGDTTVLMQDTVVVSAGDDQPTPRSAVAQPGAKPVVMPPTAVTALPTFRSFSDAEADPVAAVDSLRGVFQAAAEGIVRRIT